MSYRISLWVGLIGIAATIPLVQPNIASAKTPVEIAKTARAITVLITEPDSVGSGVILQRQGDIYTVLTAAHVVKNKGKVVYKITTPDDRKHDIISSSIRSAPGSIDLAVVKFKSTTNYPLAKLGNCNLLEMGMDLYVGGFPGTSRAINELIFVFREGKVTANSNKALENGYSLVYSNDTRPGMSGGAVLNSDGELVAIHGRGDKVALPVKGGNGEEWVKDGFNLGIPINRFAMVASNMGVDLGGQVAAIPQNTAPKADDYIASAAQKKLKKDYRGAIADLDRAIQLDPNNATTYLARGEVKELEHFLGKRGQSVNVKMDYRSALADLDRAIQLNPNFAEAYVTRGRMKSSIDLGDYWGALADYNRAIQLNPNLVAAYIARGEIKGAFWLDNIRKKDFQGAVADLKQARQLAKQQFAIAVSRQDTDGQNESDLLYVAAGATSDSFHAQEIDIKERSGDYRGALEGYSQMIAINPTAANYIRRGSYKYKLKDYSGTISDYKQALSIRTAYYKRHLSYYYKHSSDGRSPDSLKEDYLKDIKSTISDIQQAAKLQGDLKSYQFAVEYLKKIEGNNSQPITTSTSNAESYYNQGDKKADAGNYREAIVDFSRSIALNPRYVRAYVGRGISKYELKDYSGAISDYKQALSIEPQYASAYFNLGLAKDKLNDLKGAISDMQQAVKLYQQQGKQQDAQEAIDQIKKWQQTSNNSRF